MTTATATTPVPVPVPMPYNYNPALNGCTFTGCGTQDTATVDGHHGRRCTQHPPTFEPAQAVNLAIKLSPAAAFSYCRTELPA